MRRKKHDYYLVVVQEQQRPEAARKEQRSGAVQVFSVWEQPKGLPTKKRKVQKNKKMHRIQGGAHSERLSTSTLSMVYGHSQQQPPFGVRCGRVAGATPPRTPPASPSLSRGESVYLFVYAFSVFAIRHISCIEFLFSGGTRRGI